MKLISIDGVDGAGKTFLLNSAIEYCTYSQLNPVRYHLRPKIIRRPQLRVSELSEKSPDKQKNPVVMYITDIMRLWMLACDYVIFMRYLLLSLRIKKIDVVFFDRYSETLVLEPWRFGLNYKHRAFFLLIHFLSPKPHFRIVINADPREIVSRKAELTEAEIIQLQTKRQEYYTKESDKFIENKFDVFTIARLNNFLGSILK
ncbi:hypothetical protein N9V26_03605 [Amylibacter sp.]|nr:hypothetical protein [Amylibacter sp.]